MKHFAVIGCPIEHSLSPLLHQEIYRQLNISAFDLFGFPMLIEPQMDRSQTSGIFRFNIGPEWGFK